MRISDWSSDVCSSDLQAILLVVELPVPPAQREQFRLGAPLHDAPMLQHEDLVRARDGREPMRDHERRAPRAEAAQSIANELLALADRKSVVAGTSVSVRVYLGGRRNLKQKKKT